MAERIAVDVIKGTALLNRHVLEIQCIEQRIRVRNGKLPIVVQQHARALIETLAVCCDRMEEVQGEGGGRRSLRGTECGGRWLGEDGEAERDPVM